METRDPGNCGLRLATEDGEFEAIGMEIRNRGEHDSSEVVEEHPCPELCVGEKQRHRSLGVAGGRLLPVPGVDKALLVDEEGAVGVNLARDGDERLSSGCSSGVGRRGLLAVVFFLRQVWTRRCSSTRREPSV